MTNNVNRLSMIQSRIDLVVMLFTFSPATISYPRACYAICHYFVTLFFLWSAFVAVYYRTFYQIQSKMVNET